MYHSSASANSSRFWSVAKTCMLSTLRTRNGLPLRVRTQSPVKETSSMVVGICGNLFLLCRYNEECIDGNVGTMLTASDAEGCWDKATMVSVYIVGTGVASVLALSFITSMVFEAVTWRGLGMWLWLLFSLTTESSSTKVALPGQLLSTHLQYWLPLCPLLLSVYWNPLKFKHLAPRLVLVNSAAIWDDWK